MGLFQMEDDLSAARRWYAEDLRLAAAVQSSALVEAFATVPREVFVGPAPWHVLSPRIGGLDPTQLVYRTIEENDPRILYHDMLVALDKERKINNGQPSFWAINFDAVAVTRGDAVVHIGCGTGYYTAILAEMAGPHGVVMAVELDDALVQRAKKSLSAWSNVTVQHADGATYDRGPVDVIVVNAGMTHPLPLWLDRLKPRGRLLLPLTVEGPIAGSGLGWMFLITRTDRTFALRVVCPTGIIHFTGARDAGANARLETAFRQKRGALASLRSLRQDPHDESPECWLHSDAFCLSLADTATVH
jgi:protein-L-isoaspartate(D-aspartate) O-methyltransferase